MISATKGPTMAFMTTPTMRWLRGGPALLFFVCVAVCTSFSCGSKDVQPTEPDQPWVREYQATAGQGCKCKTEACFNRAKQKLDTLVADHGGFDEVPLSVHEAHKGFDPCWRAGTADLARDLAKATDAVCRCADAPCVQNYREGLVRLEDKYGTNFEQPFSSDVSTEARTEIVRADECLAAISIPGEEYLAYMEETTIAVCACSELDCLQKVLGERMEKLKGHIFVDSLASIQQQLDILNQRYCTCLGATAARDIAEKMLGGIPVQLDMKVSCGS